MKHLALIAFSLLFVNSAFALKVKPYHCPVAVKCAPPPEKCDWTMELDKKGCVVGCGELTCEVQECGPVPDCAAPPEGCNYTMELDANGCVIGCGKLICGSTCENVQAPVCAAPPEGCNWTMEPGADGCPSCGTLNCVPHGGGGYNGPMDGPNGKLIKKKQ